MTPDRHRLLAVARKRLGIEEADWRELLAEYGGVSSSRDLDSSGFDCVTARLRQLGFTSDYWKAGFGERRDMASPHQIHLINALWLEAAANPTTDHLRAWLAKTFKVSDLRFLPASKAPGVIGALRAMKARRGAKKVERYPDG